MQKTSISWTDYTSNPIIAVDRATGKRGWACTRVSKGCESCYAAAINQRLGTGHDFDAKGNAAVEWRLHEPEVHQIWLGKSGRKVFVEDMSDLYHEAVPDAWRDEIHAAMWSAHRTTFQTLTKRADAMHAYWTAHERRERLIDTAFVQWQRWGSPGSVPYLTRADVASHLTLPLPNLWMGVSTEDQATANERIPDLLETPAAVRFLSVEPLLGAIDLRGTGPYHWPLGPMRHKTIDWIIPGGESGGQRRPMELAWLESIVSQCQAAGIPVWVKQDNALRPGQQGRIPDQLFIQQFPQHGVAG